MSRARFREVTGRLSRRILFALSRAEVELGERPQAGRGPRLDQGIDCGPESQRDRGWTRIGRGLVTWPVALI